MGAKDITLKPVKASEANETIKRLHYSGKVVQNSQLHIGVFLDGRLEGAMQFGPSLDKRKIQGLVANTGWNEFIELNRMAFSDRLPRNSESRAIAIAMKLLKKYAPQIKWVISFADACQCGDGAIYRASGFVLTGIKRNTQNYKLPRADQLDFLPLQRCGVSQDEFKQIQLWLNSITPKSTSTEEGAPHAHKMSLEGAPHAHKMSLEGGQRPSQHLSNVKKIMRRITNGATSADKFFRLIGGEPAVGFQLRYIYFIDKSYRANLSAPEIPFRTIQELGANMYKGVNRAGG